jgi:hypothetical protein
MENKATTGTGLTSTTVSLKRIIAVRFNMFPAYDIYLDYVALFLNHLESGEDLHVAH